MANVTGQSAEHVSSQMTAIWNNFDDGSKSLEYYADAITALGANTASSSDEIARGLEKFASIAQTTGLSYEYATASLATLVATTRQSADTVGNSLKTIFSRLLGLKQDGATEDGVTLNKYSAALSAVGVLVLDTEGQLRDLDNILDDLAGKWEGLSRAQQNAVAQTVGGTRLYAQLIALMENWDDMQKNVLIASDSEGTLQEQADIYADSWEASKKRVRAALEEIYGTLIDPEFFKGVNDAVADTLGIIKDLIDGIGGASGAFLLLGNIMLKTFSGLIANAISDASRKISYFNEDVKNTSFVGALKGEGMAQRVLKKRDEIIEARANNATGEEGSKEREASSKYLRELAKLDLDYFKNIKSLSEHEKEILAIRRDGLKNLGDLAAEAGKVTDELEKQLNITEKLLLSSVNARKKKALDKADEALADAEALGYVEKDKGYEAASDSLKEQINANRTELEELRKNKEEAASQLKADPGNEDLQKKIAGYNTQIDALSRAYKDLASLKKLIDLGVQISGNTDTVKSLGEEYTKLSSAARDFAQGLDMVSAAEQKEEGSAEQAAAGLKEIENAMAAAEKNGVKLNEVVTKSSGFTSYDLVKNSINTLKLALEEGTLSATEAKQALDLMFNSDAGTVIAGSMDKVVLSMKNLGMSDAEIARFTEGLDISSDSAKKYQQIIKLLEAELEAVKEKQEEAFNNKNVNIGKNISNLLSSMGQLAMGFNSLRGAWRAWNDETLSGGDKAILVITGISMGIPSIISAVQALKLEEIKETAVAAARALISPFGLALAGATALAAGIFYLATRESEEEQAAKKATEQAKELKSTYEETLNSYNELKTAFDDYSSMREALSECTYGTKEWYEQLDKVNEKALELIRLHPELAQTMTRSATGEIILSDKDVEAVEKREYNNVQAAGLASDVAKVQANNATSTLESAQEAKKADKEFFKETGAGVVGMGFALNMLDDLRESGFAAMNSLGTFKQRALEVVAEKGAAYESEELLENFYNSIKENLGNLMIDANSSKGTQEQVSEAAYNRLLANSEFSSKLDEAELRIIAQDMANNLKELLSENEKKSESLLIDELETLLGRKLSEELQAQLDEQDNPLELLALWVASLLAYNDALEEGTAGLRDVLARAKKLEETKTYDGVNVGSALSSFTGGRQGSLQGATLELLAAIKNDVNNQGELDLLSQLAEERGYEDGEAYREALLSAIADAETRLEDIGNSLSSSFTKNLYEGLDKSKFSTDTLGSIADGLDKAFLFGGQKGAESLQKIISSMDNDTASKFLDAFHEIDWNSGDAVENLKNRLSELGIVISDTSGFNTFCDSMLEVAKSSANVSSELERLTVSAGAAKEVLSKLKLGKIISDKDYEKLIAAAPALRELFLAATDGFLFVGTLEEANAMFKESMGSLKDYIEVYNNMNSAGELLSGKDYDYSEFAGQVFDEGLYKNNEEAFLSLKTYSKEVFDEIVNNSGHSANEISEAFKAKAYEVTDTQKLVISDFWNSAALLSEGATNGAFEAENAMRAYVNTCVESLEQLNELNLTQLVYSEGLLKLASEYDNTAIEIKNYRDALEAQKVAEEELRMAQNQKHENMLVGMSESEAEKAAGVMDALTSVDASEASLRYAESLLEIATAAGEVAAATGAEASSVEDLIKSIMEEAAANDESNDILSLSIHLASEHAKQVINENNAIQEQRKESKKNVEMFEALAKHGEDYNEAIKDVVGSGGDLAKQFSTLKKNMSLYLNIAEDAMDPKFVAKWGKTFQDACDGNLDAMEEFNDAAKEWQAQELEKDFEIKGIDPKEIDEALGDTYNTIADWMANLPEGELSLDNQMALVRLANLRLAAGESLDDIVASFAAAGITLDVSDGVAAANYLAQVASEKGQAVADALTFSTERTTAKKSETDETEVNSVSIEDASLVIEGTLSVADGEGKNGPTSVKLIPMSSKIPGWTANITPAKQTKKSEDTAFSQKVITGANYSPPGGGVTEVNKAPSGGGGGRGGGGGGGRRGGGGSGSGRAARRNAASTKSTTSARYAKIDKQIEKLTSQYDNMDKAKERAYGKNVLKLMDKEIEKNQELIDKNKERLKLAKDYLAIDKTKLFTDNKLENVFDEDGNLLTGDASIKTILGKSVSDYIDESGILDLTKLQKDLDDWYNKLVKIHNTKTEDDTAEKNRWALVEAQYEAATEAMEQYLETEEEVKTTQEEIWDAFNANIDSALEKTELAIEQRKTLLEAEKEWIDYLYNKSEDNAYAFAERLDLLGDKVATAVKDVNELWKDASNTISNSLVGSGVNKGVADTVTTEIIDYIKNKEYTKAELKYLDLVKQQIRDNNDVLTDEEVIALAESLTSEVMGKVVETAEGVLATAEELQEEFRQTFEELDKVIDKNSEKWDLVNAKVEYLSTTTENYRNIIDILGKTNNAFKMNYFDEITKSLNRNLRELTKLELQNSRNRMLAAQADLAEIERIIQENSDSWTDLEKEQWNLRLLTIRDTAQSASEEWQSAWQEALEKTMEDFEKAAEQIAETFSKEISGIAGSLDALRSNYDMAKEIDEDYIDNYKKVYNLSKMIQDVDKLINNTDNLKYKKLMRNFEVEINELLESDQEMSEYDLDYLLKKYELLKALLNLEEAQNNKSTVRMVRNASGNYGYVYTADLSKVEDAESEYRDRLYDLQEANEEYINNLLDNMLALQETAISKLIEIGELYGYDSEQYEEVFNYYQNQLNYFASEMEKAFGNNKELYDIDLQRYILLTNDKTMLNEIYTDNFNETILSVKSGFESLAGYIENANNAFKDALNSLVAATDSMKEFNEEINKVADGRDVTLETIIENISDVTSEMGESLIESNAILEETIKIFEEATNKVNDWGQANRENILNSIALIEHYYDTISRGLNADLINVGVNNTPLSFDTGGYTGSWGGEGKLAMVHQKELILNESDTENILAAIGTIRDISKMIDINALSSSGMFNYMYSNNLRTAGAADLNQNITITAEFPNATDRNEILAAFENLQNKASLFANRF